MNEEQLLQFLRGCVTSGVTTGEHAIFLMDNYRDSGSLQHYETIINDNDTSPALDAVFIVTSQSYSRISYAKKHNATLSVVSIDKLFKFRFICFICS